MEKLRSAFELKSVSEQGTFSGYGSVWNVQDHYDDVVVRGAFSRSLAEHKAAGTSPLLLWQHNSNEPIGVYTNMAEDDHGLFVEGKLALKTQRGAEAYELMKMGALTGLSIGFVTRDFEFEKASGVRKVKDVDLWEVSPVSFPANTAARVESVRSRNEKPTIRALEEALRDAGLSRSEAKAVLTGGHAALRDVAPNQRDAGEQCTDEAHAILSMMRKLRIGG